MGVDYSGNFGFGVEVLNETPPNIWVDGQEGIDPEYLREYIFDWLEELPEGLLYFEVGSGAYTGKQNKIYIISRIIEKILEEGRYNELNNSVEQFKKTLNSLGVEYKGNPCLVGGLQIS